MADPIRVSRAVLFVALVCACTQPRERPAAAEVAPAVAPPPAEPSPPADDPAAADRVRDLALVFDPEACVAEGETLLRAHPNDSRLRAWTLACVADSGRRLEAEALAEQLRTERPDDPWAEFARVAVGLVDPENPDRGALLAAEALTTRLDNHPDILRLRARPPRLRAHRRRDGAGGRAPRGAAAGARAGCCSAVRSRATSSPRPSPRSRRSMASPRSRWPSPPRRRSPRPSAPPTR
ncbi:hypothetical protein OV079_33675 [Nannocystis pusilla]|uniref:Tetratricopeptide repeat protein n=1 Tax=Nannocystis pusilla TaxID=889268 RepID=A0A9X3EUE7_9BACT|nr:hypothetical protein [Nannocystis pusilla]MCY1010433.1 hypothetical protein [Nannocystis pusilla]